MDSLTNGPFGTFNSCTSGLMSSACTHSGSDRQHYHRHCGCAFHSIDKGFRGSPSCTPSCTVKVAGKASSSGIYRSMSVQNLGEKYSPASSSGHSIGEEESAARFGFDSRDSDAGLRSFSSSLSLAAMDKESSRSVETVTLVEELANFIHAIKEEHPRSGAVEVDDQTIDNETDRTADKADFMSFSNSMTTFPHTAVSFDGVPEECELTGLLPLASSMLLGESFGSSALGIPLYDHLAAFGVPFQGNFAINAEVPHKPEPLIRHRRMRSIGV